MKLTGERVVSGEGDQNPTWQRHVSAYRLIAPMLTGDTVLDLGCGVGHSYRYLAGASIGLDRHIEPLIGQGRPVMAADMRSIPLGRATTSSVVSVQSIEHVPDPDRAIAECARVLRPDGVAVFVTPNRLTFGRPDEVIDPWHFVEFSSDELARLCRKSFSSVELLGLFGSDAYCALWKSELARMERVLSFDPLRLRRLLPRRARQSVYGYVYRRARGRGSPQSSSITAEDFYLKDDGLDECLDLIAVCRRPLPPR